MATNKGPRGEHERASTPKERYAPPRLVRLGNVRDVLGKTGAAKDKSQTNPTKP